MSQFDDIKDFHDKFGLSAEPVPHTLDPEEQQFRIKCLYEELQEYERAVTDFDLPEQLDALIDLVYFAMGTAHRCGFPWNHGWQRVQEANMTKVMGPNGVEIVKPVGWQAPDLHEVIQDYDIYDHLKGNRGLITLDGPDGTGKSTLARRIAYLYGGEVIHLTWTPRLDQCMNSYRIHAIEYAARLAEEKVVVLERPWLCHPIYASVYRNDTHVHDWETWRDITEHEQCLGIIALPNNSDKWFKDYIHNANTRHEHYSSEAHSKMQKVYEHFATAFYEGSDRLGIKGLDRTAHIQYDYQQVNPVNELDDWIVENTREHLGIK